MKPEMVVIPAGSFRMGNIQSGGGSNEKPVHKVNIDYQFAMGKYEITVGEFKEFIKSTDYKTEKNDGYHVYNDGSWAIIKDANWQNPYFSQQDNYPVICISWNDANAYTKWLSEQTGKQYRLPSDEEETNLKNQKLERIQLSPSESW